MVSSLHQGRLQPIIIIDSAQYGLVLVPWLSDTVVKFDDKLVELSFPLDLLTLNQPQLKVAD